MNKLPCPRRRSGEVIVYDSLTSPTGTFRTWHNVRLESAMRFKADIGRSNIAACFKQVTFNRGRVMPMARVTSLERGAAGARAICGRSTASYAEPTHVARSRARQSPAASYRASQVSFQFSLSPMSILARRIEHALDVTIQRPHDADACKHCWPVMFRNEQQRLHRGLPFVGIVFCLG